MELPEALTFASGHQPAAVQAPTSVTATAAEPPCSCSRFMSMCEQLWFGHSADSQPRLTISIAEDRAEQPPGLSPIDAQPSPVLLSPSELPQEVLTPLLQQDISCADPVPSGGSNSSSHEDVMPLSADISSPGKGSSSEDLTPLAAHHAHNGPETLQQAADRRHTPSSAGLSPLPALPPSMPQQQTAASKDAQIDRPITHAALIVQSAPSAGLSPLLETPPSTLAQLSDIRHSLETHAAMTGQRPHNKHAAPLGASLQTVPHHEAAQQSANRRKPVCIPPAPSAGLSPLSETPPLHQRRTQQADSMHTDRLRKVSNATETATRHAKRARLEPKADGMGIGAGTAHHGFTTAAAGQIARAAHGDQLADLPLEIAHMHTGEHQRRCVTHNTTTARA